MKGNYECLLIASTRPSLSYVWKHPADCLDQMLGFKTLSKKCRVTPSLMQSATRVLGAISTCFVVRPMKTLSS